jgi:hypothetical protein
VTWRDRSLDLNQASHCGTCASSGDNAAAAAEAAAGGEDIVSSGDEVADTDARNKFVSAFEAKRSVKVDGKDR